MYPILFDHTQSTNAAWKRILETQLRQAASFEIHCWAEEMEEIAAALHFGQRKETDWQWGTVIAGAVTPAFIDFLLSLPKPTDTEIYNKMTPFFSLFLDTGFSSEHYGTELYLPE